jgi:predicted RNase H-like nuclease (RuvC/YqgF family)
MNHTCRSVAILVVVSIKCGVVRKKFGLGGHLRWAGQARIALQQQRMTIYDQLNGLPGEVFEQSAKDALDMEQNSGAMDIENPQVEIRKLQYEMRELRESTGKWITMLEINMKELQSQIDCWKKEKEQMHNHLTEAIQRLQQENEVTTPYRPTWR